MRKYACTEKSFFFHVFSCDNLGFFNFYVTGSKLVSNFTIWLILHCEILQFLFYKCSYWNVKFEIVQKPGLHIVCKIEFLSNKIKVLSS